MRTRGVSLPEDRRYPRHDFDKGVVKAAAAAFKPFYETYGRHSVYLHVVRK